MTPKDGEGLSEDDVDEIVERVVERLGTDGEDAGNEDASGDTVVYESAEQGSAEQEGRRENDERRERAGEEAEERAERIEEHAERLEERAERGSERFDRLGERIEDEVERRLERLADSLERSLGGGTGPWPQPPQPPAPEGGRDRAVYKTQLQKGGRVAVPDAEIEALDLEPGDTLQVTLYEIG